MRILGLDYGDKTIGVAVSDGERLIAQSLEVIRREDESSIKKSVKRLIEIIHAYNINTIVLGYPKNMDGSEGFRCKKTIEFKERLERNIKNVKIILWDERLSTVAASYVLSDLTPKKKKLVVDKVAATLILQCYLDHLNTLAD